MILRDEEKDWIKERTFLSTSFALTIIDFYPGCKTEEDVIKYLSEPIN